VQCKIVILDGIFANPGDLSWDNLKTYGELYVYENTSKEQIIERCKDAQIVITNKVGFGEPEIAKLPKLKLIALAATGMDHIDLQAAKSRGIEVKNAVGYSTNSVAQHVLALLLALENKVGKHNQSVQSSLWDQSKGFHYTISRVTELAGKKIGIYGFGKIGQRVAELAKAFQMQIMIVSSHADPEEYEEYQFVSLKELFIECDVISLHAPLKKDNHGIINEDLFNQMKPWALLINTARGGLINEQDLAIAIKNGRLRGAGLDVLSEEPPSSDHPLIGLENCLVTPHMAWASFEARKELISQIEEHIRKFVG
jgi:glycerate dehydrogenase